MNQETSKSDLDHLIPPEIKNDEFYAAIEQIVREENIKTVLEIGSSSGEGSTEALVRGIRENPNKPKLFCMEVSKVRFAELQKRYANDSFVNCYNLSSVSLEDFPDRDEVIEFYNNTPSNLNYYPLEQVLGWLRQDVEYVKNAGVLEDGIQRIKEDNNIDTFDVVIIDGSEFTGSIEWHYLYGANLVFLDDINTFKNYSNHLRLMSDSNYINIAHNNNIRNGYSIFKRVEKEEFHFEPEQSEQLLVKNIVTPGMIVFDVGANIGDYSLLFSQQVGNGGKVYSFEPTSSTFKKLQERIEKLNITNIYLYQKAVFSESIQIELNEFPDDYSAWNSIGKPQMLNPKNLKDYVPIIKTELVEAIALDDFSKEYSIKRIDYLKVDVEGAESDVFHGAHQLLRNKAIRFIQFEISQNMLAGLNRKAKDTFDILIENGYECHQINRDGTIGEKINNSQAFYENYIAFPELPIHFLTIVLNGEPFIRYHIDVFKQLPFKWHWHIVEGVADLKHDTAWSLRLGGGITDDIHHRGRSKDGTTQYIDELAQLYPDNVTVYRKPEGVFWEGKLEMVNAPLANIQEECLLWQIDVDELWTVEQICTARHMFVANPDKTAAWYWCWYFVGENLVISTRNCYAQNPQQDWLRTWRFKPGMVWAAHEPPILVESLPDNQWRNVATVNPFLHRETEARDLVFQHFAYVTPSQLRFKEQYYGYGNAVSQWTALQKQPKFPVLLREYFPWVGDDTRVDTVESCNIVPIAQKVNTSDVWHFIHFNDGRKQFTQIQPESPIILVDGIFFQRYQTGIARLWRSILQEWAANGFAQHIIVLDRAETAPKIPGIRYRVIPPHDYSATDADREMLQQICDEEGADLFISTYYTTPISTPSIFMAYDMIPEVLGADFEEPMWREKHYGIQHASAYIAISHNTARDLAKFFPHIPLESIAVAQCGVDKSFSPATEAEIAQFKTKYGIAKPYFLAVGIGSNYKNSELFFQAFASLYSKEGLAIVCTGSGGFLPEELRNYTVGTTVYMLHLSDEELRVAYSGAVALVYPSLYEGFGLPVLEAMACGCPIITCPNASIPEVAGEAAIYVKDNHVEGMANALCEVQKPTVRNSLILAGLTQAQKFSWLGMADKVSAALIDAAILPFNLNDINLIIFPDWCSSEEELGVELGQIFSVIANHPDRSRIAILVYRGDISEEDANLFLSGVAMNLLMENDLDITEEIAISSVGSLNKIQWETLLPRLQGRISLEVEEARAIPQLTENNLPILTIDTIPQMRGVQLVTGNWTLIKLGVINFVIFPDWQQEEESIYQELAQVITTIITHPESSQISLFIDISNTSEDEANLMLSSITMNLLMTEDWDVAEAPEIILLPPLTMEGWQVLLPSLHCRIILEKESQEIQESIPAYRLDELPEISKEELLINLANQLFQEEKWQGAIQPYQQVINLQAGDAEVYWRLSQCFRQNNLLEEYFSTLEAGIQVYPQDGRLHFHLIIDLQRNRRIEEAIECANRASDFLPDNYTFTLLKYLLIPSIYNEENEIGFYRQRFTDGLQTLIQETSLETSAEKQEALAGISRLTNFSLGYQAQNDIELQRQYGNLVHRIMAANYPQWIESKPLPPLKDNQKIRIGYVSAYLHSYSGTLWLQGWLRYCDSNRFEIYCYYTGNSPDLVTEKFREYSDVFHHIPFSLEAISQQIITDELHILIFPEIGMDAPTMAMAGLRLAPIQCVAWGHPVTTGLPTIDYFLSSELMEPENAVEHYTETLIRLPNIGVAYPKPYIPSLRKTRADFQLREDAVIYLCCQAPFKYLPQYDFILPEIARHVPQSQLLFLRGELLKPRLQRAFANLGLDYEDYCLFRTIPGRDNYLAINLLSDVYLDTITWSGGNTSLEAIACNLPIVTYPGEFMRGRHTDSFLKMLGVKDTIAQSEVEYIEIAVKLGLDSAWRQEISARMKERHDSLYEDKACVAGLEAFYQEVVRERLAQ